LSDLPDFGLAVASASLPSVRMSTKVNLSQALTKACGVLRSPKPPSL
jgi:hypothetical protein